MNEATKELLLTNCLSNLTAAMEYLTSPCNDECSTNCEVIAHDGAEPDCESAVDEILEASRRIQEYLNA